MFRRFGFVAVVWQDLGTTVVLGFVHQEQKKIRNQKERVQEKES